MAVSGSGKVKEGHWEYAECYENNELRGGGKGQGRSW